MISSQLFSLEESQLIHSSFTIITAFKQQNKAHKTYRLCLVRVSCFCGGECLTFRVWFLARGISAGNQSTHRFQPETQQHLKVCPQIHTNRMQDKFIAGKCSINEKTFNNGLEIFKKLQQRSASNGGWTSKDKNGIYGIVLQHVNTTNKDLIYIGSYNRMNYIAAPKLDRCSEQYYTIRKIFENGIWPTKHRSTYASIACTMVKNNKKIKFMKIENLGFDPRIVEGVVKMTEILSNGTIYPNLANQQVEFQFDNRELKDIFQTNENIIDFAVFMTECLLTDNENTQVSLPNDMDDTQIDDSMESCLDESLIIYSY